MSELPITVSSSADLNSAIEQLDQTTTAGNYTIVFTGNITEGEPGQPDGIYAISLQSGVTLTIDGGGYALDGAGSNGGLAVISGDVTIQNLSINGTLAQGGAGQGDGGGGAGLGGGLFVGETANVTLDNVLFTGDAAQGGAGGDGGAAAGGNSSIIFAPKSATGHPAAGGAQGLPDLLELPAVLVLRVTAPPRQQAVPAAMAAPVDRVTTVPREAMADWALAVVRAGQAAPAVQAARGAQAVKAETGVSMSLTPQAQSAQVGREAMAVKEA